MFYICSSSPSLMSQSVMTEAYILNTSLIFERQSSTSLEWKARWQVWNGRQCSRLVFVPAWLGPDLDKHTKNGWKKYDIKNMNKRFVVAHAC